MSDGANNTAKSVATGVAAGVAVAATGGAAIVPIAIYYAAKSSKKESNLDKLERELEEARKRGQEERERRQKDEQRNPARTWHGKTCSKCSVKLVDYKIRAGYDSKAQKDPQDSEPNVLKCDAGPPRHHDEMDKCCVHSKKAESEEWCQGCKQRAQEVKKLVEGVKSCLQQGSGVDALSAASQNITSFKTQDSNGPAIAQHRATINKWHIVILIQTLDGSKVEELKLLIPQVISGGKLDLSKSFLEPDVPTRFFPDAISPYAAIALRDSGITCLDVRSNPYLLQLPVKELCDISTLKRLECAGCLRLYAPPSEVAEDGGAEVMSFLRECIKDGALNDSLALVFLGDGETGKTSTTRALMNVEGNTAGKIAKDTRTVGLDMVDWHTNDDQGNELIFKIKDVGGQHVYMKLHELFIITRAVYCFLWRADCEVEQAISSIPHWLNLLQSRVPGVSVVPIVTHIDCVSPADLETKKLLVQKALMKWQKKQTNLPAAADELIVSVLENGRSHGVNCLKGDGIEELRSLLWQVARKTRGFGEPMPKQWKDLRDAIRGKTERFMQWDEYRGLCKSSGIQDKQVLSVTSFLHETAEMRYFGIPAMKNRSANLEDFLTTALGDREVSDNARELFDQIDTDKSGGIDKDELETFLRAKGLGKANIETMMQSAGGAASRTGLISFEEFQKMFENALSSSGAFSSVVYLDSEWMIDIIKGIIRHEHGALHQHLAEESDLRLMHQARRLRVQGIISKDLLIGDGNYLWPGAKPPTPFWSKVAAGGSEIYDYERQLWDDGKGELRNIVASKNVMDVALNLLVGFKVITASGTDSTKANSEYLCPDLIPEHMRVMTGEKALVKVSCPYWHKRTYAEVPFGFWNNIFMEIRSKASSGTPSAHRHTFFILSAKLHITQTKFDGKYTILVRASTQPAFEMALNALQKAQKFYPGMAIWELSRRGISDEESASIQDPAHVLVMTAGMVMQKTPGVIRAFNSAYAKVADELKTNIDFILRAQTDPTLDEWRKESVNNFSTTFDIACGSMHDLNSRLNNLTPTLGLKWTEVGSQAPTEGQEIQHEALLAKLEQQQRKDEERMAKSECSIYFTEEEWQNLNIPTLTEDTYIKAGDKYFKPAGNANHCTGSMSLADVSAGLSDLVECTLRPEYGNCMRAVVRYGSAPSTAKRNQIVDGSHLVWDHAWFGIPLGLTWRKLKRSTSELLGRRLTNEELTNALKTKSKFTAQEWAAFGIEDLQPDDFVEVGASYFKPVAISLPALDKALYKALQNKDIAEAERLLLRGADPSYFNMGMCFLNCFGWKWSVAAANAAGERMQELLHSFGCDDSALAEASYKYINRIESGHRVQASLLQGCDEPYFNPTSKKLLLPEEEALASSDAAKWIDTFFDVVDDFFANYDTLKEIFCPHRLYHGKAQVVLVLLDKNVARFSELCSQFAVLEKQGCQIIGVPMPGYDISDFNKWWPDELPAFKDHSLFFDCRHGAKGDKSNGAWEDDMKKKLMPQIHQFLEEWNEKNPSASVPDVAAPLDDIQPEGNAPRALQERTYVSKEEMRASMLPCPSCLEKGEQDPGAFNRDECMLHFASVASERSNSKGLLYCDICDTKVKVKDVLKRPIFLSYNWGENNCTQKIATKLCDRIFQATEMPYWLDIEGGMGYGEELVTEMREGVKNCKIVIIMISDNFCNSGNCLFEYINIVQNRKYVIPLLVPGWQGQLDGTDWWMHALQIFKPERSAKHPQAASFKNIPWDYLAEFKPIDLRGEDLQDDGSLQDNSAAEQEIIRRIMSRFFRDGGAGSREVEDENPAV